MIWEIRRRRQCRLIICVGCLCEHVSGSVKPISFREKARAVNAVAIGIVGLPRGRRWLRSAEIVPFLYRCRLSRPGGCKILLGYSSEWAWNSGAVHYRVGRRLNPLRPTANRRVVRIGKVI